LGQYIEYRYIFVCHYYNIQHDREIQYTVAMIIMMIITIMMMIITGIGNTKLGRYILKVKKYDGEEATKAEMSLESLTTTVCLPVMRA
jgi:hypothetical protein